VGTGSHVDTRRGQQSSRILRRPWQDGRGRADVRTDNANRSAQTGDLSIVQYTLDHGADAKVADTTGWTALHSAAAEGHESIVKLLLDNGVDVSATDEDGDTALLTTALRGKESTIQLLLAENADIHQAPS
jgi:ankyrin repeat protein